MQGRVVLEPSHGGAVLRAVFKAPPGNILDIATLADLRRRIAASAASPGVKAIVFEGAGPDFSYGVSIEEHRPRTAARMLRSFHDLFRSLLRLDRVLIAVVRGRCLGGGMELACFCHRVFAHPNARLAQPEIGLGVFPPLASVILPLRCGQAVADEACLTGRTFSAREALTLRLVDEVAADPRRAADRWIAKYLLPRSAASLRRAVRAARLHYRRTLLHELAGTERIYLRDLMRTHDAREGIEAFLEKRPPRWRDR
jgi:cyclohexa-1,5-dienecarbonyl-CoA hydratase